MLTGNRTGIARVPGTVNRRIISVAGQRVGGLGVGVAQLLGVDVVPAAAGEIGAVGGGGEAAVDDPHQPVQVPGSQVVLDRADDPLVALTAGKGPAAHRDSVAGDRHRDHHLGQVVAVVLGLAEPARRVLDRFHGAVVGLRFGCQVGQFVGHVDLPVGGGGVSLYRLILPREEWRHAEEAVIFASGGSLVGYVSHGCDDGASGRAAW